jgi:hypothetical protein
VVWYQPKTESEPNNLMAQARKKIHQKYKKKGKKNNDILQAMISRIHNESQIYKLGL